MKHLLTFETYNGPNLQIDQNPVGGEWYGGGITATPDPTTKPVNDKSKAKPPTDDARRVIRKRRKMEKDKRKKNLLQQDKIEHMTDLHTTNDVANFGEGPRKPGKAGSPAPSSG